MSVGTQYQYDPLGLWGIGDPINQGVANAITGFGDGVSRILTFSLASKADTRVMLGIDGGIDMCSASYKGGKYAGWAWGVGTLWAADRILCFRRGPRRSKLRVLRGNDDGSNAYRRFFQFATLCPAAYMECTVRDFRDECC